MANIYYKNNNNQYKKFSYLDIGAAAASHTHDISEIWGWNFKDNGCMGQNILNNIDSTHNNLLFYVPHTHSDIIYSKSIPNDILYKPTVLYYNNNQNMQQTITNAEDVDIDSYRTTAYTYNGLGTILTNWTYDTNTYNYYYYSYPLNISYIDNEDNISISFKTNLDDQIWTIEFSSQNEIVDCDSELEDPQNGNIDANYYIGLVKNNNIISDIAIIRREKKNITDENDILNKRQIEITNIKISTEATISVKQNYIDYYDYHTGIPDIASCGSLGPINENNYAGTGNSYNSALESDMIKYYRSYKFHNLLTWGQSFTLSVPIISGYCDSNAWNRGFFVVHIPYELDEGITTSHVSLSGIASIWTLGRYAGTGNANYTTPTNSDATCAYYKNLVKGTAVKSGQVTYNIYRLLPGSIWFQIYFPAANTEKISFYCPLKIVMHSLLTISISNKPT